jgi:hypothetical protein
MSKAHTSNCWTDFCVIRWSAKHRCCHSSFRVCQYTATFYNGMCTCIWCEQILCVSVYKRTVSSIHITTLYLKYRILVKTYAVSQWRLQKSSSFKRDSTNVWQTNQSTFLSSFCYTAGSYSVSLILVRSLPPNCWLPRRKNNCNKYVPLHNKFL